jgi:hypothetical protein
MQGVWTENGPQIGSRQYPCLTVYGTKIMSLSDSYHWSYFVGYAFVDVRITILQAKILIIILKRTSHSECNKP